MNCAEVSALSPLFLSGEIDPARARDFAAHLETCVSCAASIEERRLLDRQVRAEILAEELPCANLEARIREQLAVGTGARRPMRWLAAAAMAAILLGAGYYFWPVRTAKVVSDAALDHRLEIVQRQSRRWTSDSRGIEVLAQRESVPASALAALAPPGYRLERARLCILNRQLFLHLVYADAVRGREVSVFLTGGNRQRLTGHLETASGRRVYASDIHQEHVACFETPQMTAMFVADAQGQALALARFAAGVL